MKKHFFKISAVFLLVVIFPTITGLCLESLLGFPVDARTAQAAGSQMDNNEMENLNHQIGKTEKDGAPHDDSLLPCCVHGHYGAANISQLIDFEKNNIIPSFFYSEHQISKIVLPASVYYNPITAPPELSIIETTVLRL